jgi:hypothetical protein
VQQLQFQMVIDGHPGDVGALYAFKEREQERLVDGRLRAGGQNAGWGGDGLDGDGWVPYHGGIRREGGMSDRILTADDFTPHVGKGFTPLGQHRILTLVSVDRSTFSGGDTLPRTPFTLLFNGTPGDVLPEGLYDVAIQDGPEVSIYINPIQTFDRNRQDYQAVFN